MSDDKSRVRRTAAVRAARSLRPVDRGFLGVRGTSKGGDSGEGVLVPVAMPIQTGWVKSVLFDRGYLARIKGETIKV